MNWPLILVVLGILGGFVWNTASLSIGRERIAGIPFWSGIEAFFVGALPFAVIKFEEWENPCCVPVPFAIEHVWSLVMWVLLVALAVFVGSDRSNLLPPLVEAWVVATLIIGSVINAAAFLQLFEATPAPREQDVELTITALVGNSVIGLILWCNFIDAYHRGVIWARLRDGSADRSLPTGRWWAAGHFLLGPRRAPLLVLACAPVYALVTAITMLFGQRADALILAFTQTYFRGFSKISEECTFEMLNSCGGHYLCTVAARGHKGFVGAFRFGYRHGEIIVCNRQLLIANAFEELLAEWSPSGHRFLRGQYDKVGRLVREHKSSLVHAWVSDLIYLGMKPLEWLFLGVLYTFDVTPESRIARQYTGSRDLTLSALHKAPNPTPEPKS